MFLAGFADLLPAFKMIEASVLEDFNNLVLQGNNDKFFNVEKLLCTCRGCLILGSELHSSCFMNQVLHMLCSNLIFWVEDQNAI